MAQAASMAEKAPRGVEESVDEKVQIWTTFCIKILFYCN
jgi:hypothetical protein